MSGALLFCGGYISCLRVTQGHSIHLHETSANHVPWKIYHMLARMIFTDEQEIIRDYNFNCRDLLKCSLGHFVLVLLAFVVLGLVSSVLSQEIGREERLQNDIFCVEWDVKPLLSQSVSQTF